MVGYVSDSHTQDSYYLCSLTGLIAAADVQGQCEEDLEDEKEDVSWWWEGEGDFTLGHVWDVRHYLCECTCFLLLCNC